MRSRVTGKDDGLQLAYTAAAGSGYCCIIALQLLPVPSHCWCGCGSNILHSRAQIQGVLPKFLNMAFFTTAHYNFLTEKCFPTKCTTFVLTVYEEVSTINKEEGTIFRRCPSLNSGALAVPRQPKNSGAATAREGIKVRYSLLRVKI